MTNFERLENLAAVELDLVDAQNQYNAAEAELVSVICDLVNGAEVDCVSYGTGTVTAACGVTLSSIIIDIYFPDVFKTKRFSLLHLMTVTNFVQFTNDDIKTLWMKAFDVHNALTTALKTLESTRKQLELEAAKKVEADKKAEQKYQKMREKAIRDFDELAHQAKTVWTEADEFYYALGWLAKHVGSMTAILPDYLGSAFEKYFGVDAPKTLVDGRAKTSGGYAKQWSWEFKCTIKKLKETTVPACIQSITTDFSKGIHNTAFLWDLVSNYGFQFGKKQDVDRIRKEVPAQYISSFETGLAA